MVLPPKVIHPKGDTELSLKNSEISALVADKSDGKIHIEWDPHTKVTPLGQPDKSVSQCSSGKQPFAILYEGVNDYLDLCGSLESRTGTSA